MTTQQASSQILTGKKSSLTPGYWAARSGDCAVNRRSGSGFGQRSWFLPPLLTPPKSFPACAEAQNQMHGGEVMVRNDNERTAHDDHPSCRSVGSYVGPTYYFVVWDFGSDDISRSV